MKCEQAQASALSCPINSSTRTLKIEADGDARKNRIKPKIRITGHWLERAGFKPGSRVYVSCISHGVIELRSVDVFAVNAANEIQPKRCWRNIETPN